MASVGSYGQNNVDGVADGDSQETLAREICLRQLAARARSRTELMQTLARRGVGEDTATAVLDRFVEVGLIDDSAYAAAVVRSHHGVRGRSRQAVAVTLRQRGVSDGDAASALEMIDSESELQAARAIAEKKMRTLAHEEVMVQRRRLFGVLARRGYSSEVCMRVVSEIVGEPCLLPECGSATG